MSPHGGKPSARRRSKKGEPLTPRGGGAGGLHPEGSSGSLGGRRHHSPTPAASARKAGDAQGAVQRALAGVSNNATAPATVRQGRRAGQPSGQHAAADVGGGSGEASFAFDLPNSQYGGVAAGGGGGGGGGAAAAAGRRGAEAWGEQQARPQLAAPPMLPAPLNERLARLKLKMGGRKTEEGGAMGLPVGGVPGVRGPSPQPSPPPPPRAASGPVPYRPISATSSSVASGDEAPNPVRPAAGAAARGGVGGVGGGGGDALDKEVGSKGRPALSSAGRERRPSPLPPRVSSAGVT